MTINAAPMPARAVCEQDRGGTLSLSPVAGLAGVLRTLPTRRHAIRPGREASGLGFFLRDGVCGFHTQKAAPNQQTAQRPLRPPLIRGADGFLYSIRRNTAWQADH